MQHIVVTGGAGYIGSITVPLLLSAGYRVTVIDQFFFGRDSLPQHPNLQCLQQDSRELDPAGLVGVDAVIDLAAMSNDPCGEAFSALTDEVNFLARLRTAKLARDAGVRRYILPSSCSVYGYQAGVASETSASNPLTRYARANLSAENAILPMASDTFCCSALRLATVFGDSLRMRLDLVVNIMTYDAVRRDEIHVAGGGFQTRPLIHVSDAAAALIMLLTAPAEKISGRVFNAGSNAMNYTVNDIAEQVAWGYHQQIGKPCRIIHNGPQDLRNYRVDFSRISTELGWHPEVSLETGIDRLIRGFSSGELQTGPHCYTLDWYNSLKHQGDHRLQPKQNQHDLPLD